MTARPDSSAFQCSPLQLAWLHELGIEKPWLPPGIAVSPAAVAGARVAGATAVGAEAASAQGAADAPARDMPPPRPVPTSPRPAAPSVARAPKDEPTRPADAVSADLPTRAIAAAAADLDALGAAIAACEACGLCRSRHQVVVGAGVAEPAIMIVGEAPGEQEDRQGLPFVGRSGMLLDNMLATIGASRQSNVYVANAIKCRPPGNRNPRPEESAACHPYLVRQIELVNPRAILVLGRVAAQAVLSTDSSLQSLRGRPTSFTVAGRQIPTVVSYHPAYLLRRPTEKAAAWEDLQRVRAIAGLGH